MTPDNAHHTSQLGWPTIVPQTTPLPPTHAVIRMFPWSIEDGVRLHHVIHHVALGNFLSAELSWCGQVPSIVVAQVVVANNGDRL